MEKLNKIIGYILLFLGLVIIGSTLFQSYNIFTDKASAPLVFKTKISESKPSQGGVLDLQKQLDESIKKQLSEILPVETLPKVLNLISWSILSGILIFGGSQITSLGIKMIS